MNKLSETYFTIGEFASLFKLSKQTLFYYERNNILKPSYIEENGYRYYSLEQYFIFDIIINMRKLGIPLKEIADYIKNLMNFFCWLSCCLSSLYMLHRHFIAITGV